MATRSAPKVSDWQTVEPSDWQTVSTSAPPHPTATMGAAPKTGATEWLQQAHDDLLKGGGKTVIGRTLGRMQGRGDKGYTGLESGVSPGVADFMGSVPLGSIETAQGIADIPKHPIAGSLKSVGGLLHASEIPGSMIAPEGIGNKAIEALPSAKWAKSMFESIAHDAGDVPVHLTNAKPELDRFRELVNAGGKNPKVITDLVRRMKNMSAKRGPIDYNEARDFYSNLSSLSAEDVSSLNPIMRRQMTSLAQAFSKDVANAAGQVGRAADYNAAMRNYAKAAKLRKAGELMLKKFAVPLAGGAAGVAIGQHIYKGLAPRTESHPTDTWSQGDQQ